MPENLHRSVFFLLMDIHQDHIPMRSAQLLFVFLAILSTINLSGQCTLPGGWSPTIYNTSATASGLSTATGADVQISTPFDINADVTLSGCDVGVRGQGAITVKSGFTLTITSNTLVTHINTFWAGIYVENGAELVVDGNSTICHAITAIFVQITSTGDVTLDDANLIQNETGIFFGAYAAGVHPATITGTTIDGGYPTALPSGLGATYGQVGIFVGDVNDGGTPISLGLQIGSGSASANTIKNLAVGINGVNSTLLVQNCDFENIIQAASFTSSPGRGIWGIMKGPVTTADMRIGTTTAGANTFTDCDYGVDLSEFDYVKIGDNTFGESTGDFQRGIWVRESYNTVIIEDNDMEDFSDEGILVEDNGGATMNIRDNTITGTGVGCEQIGIDVVETAGTGSVTFAVRDNVISGVATGISAINAEGIEIKSTTPASPIQDIEFTQPSGCSGDLAMGIRIEDCDGALIEYNTINGQCTSCNNNEIAGIGVRRSVDTYLNGNYVELAGFGILIAQNCDEGNANCNTLDNCRYGFGFQDNTFDFGPVEYEGSPGEPSDNAWFPAATADRSIAFASADAGAVNLPWYYRAAGSTPAPGTEHDASINNSIGGGGTMLSPTSIVSTIDLCGSTMRLAEGSYENPTPAARTTQGASYELLYANYFIGHNAVLMDSAVSTSIPVFHDMVDSINAKGFLSAAAAYSSLGPINSMEEDIADAMYLASKARYRRFIDTTQAQEILAAYLSLAEVAYLETLAWSPYEESGKASSIASAILGISTWRIDSISLRKGNALVTTDVPQPLLAIFPNPASNLLRIEWTGGVDWINLYNSNGRKVQEHRLPSQEAWMTIDVSSLPNGAYQLGTCSTQNGQCQYQTLIIAR